jgi:uncharacterized protein (DUF2147 family)
MKMLLGMALFVGTAAAAYADPVEGTWKTGPLDDGTFGHVEIKPCGPAYCGALVKAFMADGSEGTSPDIGKQIVWDMSAAGDGLYKGGKIWSPDDDRTYNGKLELTGDSLAVSGCVLGFCRDGGTWTRVN